MSRHTKGPWREAGRCTNATMIASDKAENINDIAIVYDHHDEHEANARLIAAAPDMLETLRACVTDDGAACFQSDDASEIIEAMERRIRYISSIAWEAMNNATGEME